MPQKQKDTRWNCPTSVRFLRCITACAVLSKLVLLVADVFGLSRVKRQVADGSDQAVNAAGDVAEDEVSTGARGVALGLQRGVVDDKASDPAEEEGQEETNDFVVHGNISLNV